MDLVDAIRSRKSIRGYKQTPVPKEVLREIMEVARLSPSGNNIQPWEITVIAGKVLEDISRSNIERANSGAEPSRELPSLPYEGRFRQRQVEVGIEIFKLMGIAREDKKKREEWRQRGLVFFGAPAAIILSMDKILDGHLLRLMDMGTIIQTICLTALDYGLGTCVTSQGVSYPDIIRKFTGIPESRRIVMDISIGYPDWDFPANALRTGREPVENFVTWCGFD